ncbi:MAG TPA: M1 family metallopeptidase [Ilumatobacteraceae bacterium]|nr:M1 family metallopeptidase [Ilumatobacteraceae bacterium]
MSDNPYRLPRTVLPSRYGLVLEPKLDSATFSGTASIDVRATDHVESIMLNADELNIDTVRVSGNQVEFHLEPDTERLIIDAPLDMGDAVIDIAFTGTLNDKLRGWYRSTFNDEQGNERVIATTQMQATDCRRAFPCFDEPDFKAVFDVSLVIEPDLFAVSNGAEVHRAARADGKHVVTFKPTMVMSTYLVAFAVGPLEATDPTEVDGVPLRIVHVPGKGHLTAFGLEIGAFALRWYQQYYGVPYPSDKVDMLALPDFAAGAMENLGCITYRESLLLADPQTATQFELQNLADVVAHEMAHMWFGDLVTMKWWNGIWLNEAFATFMEIACCNAFRPDWLRWTTFSLERSMAFETDSLVSTRSVEFPVEAPADCDGMFDVLTYQKGGSLLRMLEQYLGAEEFRQGISLYLQEHAYGNTETGDLWDAIEKANPSVPVRTLMDSWIWQPGYPLISARLDGNELVLNQQRFAYADTDDPTLFVVPIHLKVDGVESKLLLDASQARVLLPSEEATVIVNAGGHGFMRVAYDDNLRERLSGDTLSSLSVIERYNLVDDAWNAVITGRLAAADFLGFVEAFGDDRDLAVWQAIALGLRGLGRLVEGAPYAALQQRIAALVRPVVEGLGWAPTDNESDLTSKLRGLLVNVLAVQGNDADAQARCRKMLDDPSTDPELAAASANAVAAIGTDSDFDEYVNRFRTATTPQLKLRYMFALAEFPTEPQIRRTIDLALSPEVKTQDAPFLLNRCIANRQNGAMAWETVRRQWSELLERFPNNTIVRMVSSITTLTTPHVVADVQGFFSEHPIPQAAKTLEQLLERQRVNASLRAREAEALATALDGVG